MDRLSYFWSLMVVAGTLFLVGVYKNVVVKISYILWVNRKVRGEGAGAAVEEGGTPFPKLATIVREAILQSRIKNRSSFLWLRHFLIFAGFTALFLVDCVNTVLGHYLHHYVGYEYFTSGTGRAALKFAMELSGAMLLVGLTAGLVHRAIFARTERTLIDVNLLLLLWVVTLTGLLAETSRLIVEPNDPFITSSFVAGWVAAALRGLDAPWRELEGVMWIVHATAAVTFFACVPFSKFVHVIVAPLGRSLTQDGAYGQMKRARITEGLL
jgi:nitrate reductase gamma subunit